MIREKVTLLSLLTLGIFLIGGGLLLRHFLIPEVKLPDGSPIIVEERSLLLGGEASRLYIYENGQVVYIEEKNLRQSVSKHPPTRVWKTGEINEDELESLIDIFEDSHYRELNNYYQTRGKPHDRGFIHGDMRYTVSIVYEDLAKEVTTFGYPSFDHYMTLPDMPYPLSIIYTRLRDITSKTTIVAQERIEIRE